MTLPKSREDQIKTLIPNVDLIEYIFYSGGGKSCFGAFGAGQRFLQGINNNVDQ
jgi:hypothetical protein